MCLLPAIGLAASCCLCQLQRSASSNCGRSHSAEPRCSCAIATAFRPAPFSTVASAPCASNRRTCQQSARPKCKATVAERSRAERSHRQALPADCRSMEWCVAIVIRTAWRATVAKEQCNHLVGVQAARKVERGPPRCITRVHIASRFQQRCRRVDCIRGARPVKSS